MMKTRVAFRKIETMLMMIRRLRTLTMFDRKTGP